MRSFLPFAGFSRLLFVLLALVTVNVASNAQGNALNFDGTKDYVTIPDATSLKPATATVEAWVRPLTTTGSIPIVLKLNSRGAGVSNNESYSIYLDNGKFSAAASSGSGTQAKATQLAAYSAGTWYHVAAMFTSTSVSLYVNGVLQQTASTGFALDYSTGAITIGGTSDFSTLANFSMDELRIFKTDRTAQVAADMANTINPLSNPNLVAYYSFEQGTAGDVNTGINTLTDRTSNANTGTLHGFDLANNVSNWVESYAMVTAVTTAATNVASTSFTANWNAPTIGTATNYLLDVATSSTFGASILTGYNALSVTGTSQSITGLSSGVTYYYRVRANKTSVAGQGIYSAVQSARTIFILPAISYATPQTYTSGTAITALTPTNTGGAVPAVVYGTVSTLAGNGTASFQDGTGTAANFYNPYGMVSDGTNLYVADQSNHRIRKIIIATGVVTTLAGQGYNAFGDGTGTSAYFNNPRALALDGAGNLYVADFSNNRIRKIVIATGVVTTIAGNGNSNTANGNGTSASIGYPTGIVYDGGNLYFTSQYNNYVSKMVLSTGDVTILAGSGSGTFADGTGTAASFNSPMGITTDGLGNLYVADQNNNRIRKIVIATGVVTTVAGNGNGGSNNGTGTSATFSGPVGVVFDGANNLYVADQNNQRIRKIVLSTSEVTSFVGTGSTTFADGDASTATFNSPVGVAVDGAGNLYIADQGNQRIRKVGIVGYSISPALPAGLSFDGTTGIISGTPAVTSVATTYTVTANNNAGSVSATINITVNAGLPAIGSFSPTSAGAGQTVLIAGTNFSAVTGVGFGGTPATSYTVLSETLISATVAAGTTGSVTVTTVLGTATLAGFTFLIPPAITYTTPQSYTVTGSAITALSPTNTGGAVPAVNYGAVSTLAGSNQSFQNGTGTSAYFNNPQGVVSDGTNIYVADYNNHVIRKIVIATGVTTTLAGNAGTASQQDGTGTNAYFYNPHALALDGTGNLYVTQGDYYYCAVRKIVIATGAVTTLAGGNYYPTYQDGTGPNAYFYGPQGITYDGAGNLYVADRSNNRIRKIVIATGAVSTVAGSGSSAFADGTGTSSSFSTPSGISYDGGNLYVADQNNQRIRKIVIATGVVSTIAGNGNAAFANGTGAAASFNSPSGIVADGSGNLYVADQSNQRIRKIVISSGVVTTLAGNGTATFADGTAATASFYNPYSVAVDGSGYLYVADQGNNRIRKIGLVGYSISPALPAGLSFDGTTGVISGTPTVGTLAANYTVTAANGVGSSTTVVNIEVIPAAPTVTSFTPTAGGAGRTVTITGTNFSTVTAVSFGGTAATSFNVVSATSITAVVATGTTGSVSVTTTGGTGTLAGFTLLTAPVIAYAGPQTYLGNTAITPLAPTNTGGAISAASLGTVSTLAGSGNSGSSNGTGTAATFSSPQGVVSDGTNVYVADYNNHIIRKIVIATGVTTTLAGSAGNASQQDGTGTNAYFYSPHSLALDGAGNLYVTQGDYYYCAVRKIVIATGAVTTLAGGNYYPGSQNGTGTNASFYSPQGITYDGAGNLYVVDKNNHTIRKIVISSGTVSTIAGTTNSSGFIDGTGTSTLFNSPIGIAYDAGNLYVADQNNQRIRKIVVGTSVVTTLAGNSNATFVDGTGAAASFNNPAGIVADGSGSLYVADQSNHRIRKIAVSSGAVTTLSGNGTATFVDGTATTASFNNPYGVAVDGAGYLYVADQSNQRIRQIGLAGYTITPTLPAGLSFDIATGIISGTPTVGSAATVYTITGVNSVGASTTTVSIAVTPATPTITSFSPVSVGPNQTVTITGTNFSLVTAVSFGGTAAVSYTVNSTTSITAIVGAGADGSVVVTTAGGTATLAGFTMLTAPNISYVTPQTYLAGTAITALAPTNTGGIVPAVSYGTVSTLAGSSSQSFQNGTGTSAYFNNPQGVVSDGTNVYVADYNNQVIRKIVIATGVTTTLAGSAGTASNQDGTGTNAYFYNPHSLALDGAGNLYVTQGDYYYCAVRKIVIATGAVTTLAGGSYYPSYGDGTGGSASFYAPQGITYDGAGNLYVADQNNHRIRKIVIATGTVTTIAGNGNATFGDGTGTAAYFYSPTGITYDGGNLYVADQNNHRIRKIVVSTNVVTTLAGSGSASFADGTGTAANFYSPAGIVADGSGNLYIADMNNQRIRKIVVASGAVSTLAGNGTNAFADGAAAAASFSSPYGVALDGAGYLYVADQGNQRIRKVGLVGYSISPTTLPAGLSFDGTTGTISGTPTLGQLATSYTVKAVNSIGTSTTSISIAVTPLAPTITSFTPTSVGAGQSITITGTNFAAVTGVTVGGIAVASYNVVSPTSITAILGAGATGSVAVTTTGGTATLAGFTLLLAPAISYATPQSYPVSTAITALVPTNTGGTVPVATLGVVSTLAGSGSASSGNGTGTGASFYSPQGVVSDGTNVYVADYNNHTIRKIVIATGVTTTLAGSAGNSGNQDGTGASAYFYYPHSLALDGAGNLYVTQGSYSYCTIRKIVLSTAVVTTLAGAVNPGSNDGTGTSASFYGLQGITYDGAGNLYVADQTNQRIRKIVIATGTVTTVAGNGSTSFADGIGTAATFYNPTGIAYDGGNLYVADQGNQRIRKIVISTGAVTTLAGSGTASFVDGTGTAANFYNPTGIVADGSGNLYLADMNNNRIRKIVINTGVVTTQAGSGTATFVDGAATTASFNNPYGVAVDGTGYLYVADQNNHRIRKIGLVGYSISPTTLPAGLSFDATTGTFSGTPTTGSIAKIFTVTAANSVGSNSTTVSIAIVPAAPTVTSFTPTSAGASQNVTITGTNFSAVTAVSFGGTAAINFVVNSTASITATVGAGTSGSVSVTTLGGTATLAGFTLSSPPVISYTTAQTYTIGTAITALTPTNTGSAVPAISLGTVSTLAGQGSAAFQDGTGAAAYFNQPKGIVSDGTNLYVADASNNRIRKVVISTGAVTALAGQGSAAFQDGTGTAAYFNFPSGVAIDGTNLYVADYSNNRIRKVVISTGAVTTLAGSGSSTSVDGTGTAATFYNPSGIVADGAGNLYVTDYGSSRIRKIVISTGVVTTVAGTGSAAFADGTGTAAAFSNPRAITYDGAGNLYVADGGNNRIRKIVVATGAVTTLAGSSSGYADGTGTAALFSNPISIAYDGMGNVYVGDNNRIRKIVVATAVVTTLAGNGTATFVDGVPTTASFYNPYGLATDVAGYLYVGDGNNNRIRKVGVYGYGITPALPAGLSISGSTGTISGTPTVGSLATSYTVSASNSAGTGTATQSIAVTAAVPTITSFSPTSAGAGQTVTITGTNFNAVSSVAFGGTAATSFTVVSATSITAVVAAGTTGSITVVNNGGTATLAGFTFLLPPAFTYAGPQSYSAGTAITSLAPTTTGGAIPVATPGVVTTLAGSGAQTFGDGTGTSASFNNPSGMASDGANLYLADYGNHRIRKIVIATGVVTTLAGNGSAGFQDGTGTSASFYYPRSVALDGAGNLYVADGNNNRIRKIVVATGLVTTLAGNGSAAFADGTGTGASFNNPYGIVGDGAGNLYVTDYQNHRIRKIVIATGVVTTVAGSGTAAFADGTGTAANFYNPAGITYDAGNIYITDFNNNRIRKIVASTGVVTTIAGNATAAFADGTGTAASFYNPTGVASDGVGNLYVADNSNQRIRKVVLATGDVTTFAGSGSGTFTDGTGTAASFNAPNGMVMDAGNLYIGDFYNNRIRKINVTGYSISGILPAGLSFSATTGTISGTPTTGALAATYTITGTNAAGAATATVSITVVPATPTIASFTPTSAGAGQTVTITGTNFYTVSSVTFGGTAAASYTVNSGTSITAVIAAGTTGSVSVTTTGGTATLAGYTFLIAPSITYATPQTYTAGTAITDLAPTNTGGAVSAVAAGVVTTLAGSSQSFQDGTGTSAYFNNPQGVVSDGTNVYVADYSNHVIRKIVIATGVTTTLAGSAGNASNQDGTGTNAYFYYPHALALDGAGNLYVTQGDYYYCSVRKIVIATGAVTTLAGGSFYPGSQDGTGSNAYFYIPQGITYDGAGNLYVADQNNHRIRKIVIATGTVTTIAGNGNAGFGDGTGTAAYFYSPMGITYDGGSLYVADQNNHRIRKIVIATSVVTTLAGSGSANFADGTGSAANFYSPTGIVADGSGSLYVADLNNQRIRKVVISTGTVTTLAGNGTGAFVDGTATTASFNGPFGVAIDGAGYLYVADQYNNRIRKIGLGGYTITPTLPAGLSFSNLTGVISGTPTTGTLGANYTVTAINSVGTGTATVNITVIPQTPTVTSFTPTSAGAGQTVTITGTNFSTVTGVSFGGTAATSYTVVSPTSITAVVASGTTGSVAVTTTGGTATLAGFTLLLPPAFTYAGPQTYPAGTAIAALAPISTGGAVPAITLGAVSTLAGSSQSFQNGTGTSAYFNSPQGVVSDGTNVYVADYNNQVIRKIVIATGVTTTLAGSAGSASLQDGTGTNAYFYNPHSLALDGAGNLYVTQGDYYYCAVRKIVIATGAVTTLAGGSYYPSYGDGTGGSASFYAPQGITYDGAGNLYVADQNNHRIRKIVISTGAVTTVAGNGSSSFGDGTGTNATFFSPTGIAYDGGNLYVADQNNHRIRKIVASTNVVTTLAGSGSASFADGTGTAANFYAPTGIVADGLGNLYIADLNNQRIRKIVIASGAVSTLAGNGTNAFADGAAAAASFSSPYGVAVDGAGYLYVADQGNQRIRKIGLVGYSISPTTLPAGLSFDGTTGTFSGTPTTGSLATVYTVTGTSTVGTGTATVSIAVTPAAPTITSFTPTSAGAAQTVTITGTNFYAVTAVTFGGTAAASYTVNSGTSITAIIGAGATGSVTVTTSGGTATLAGFTLLLAPAITYTTPQVYTTNTAIAALTPTNTGGSVPAINLGVVSTLAGSGNASSTNGNGTAASFYNPQGVVSDGTNVYVADYNNHIIRKIVIATGVTTTLAGSAGTASQQDGTGTNAYFYYPHGLALDGAGNLYVTQGNGYYQSYFAIRKVVIATGVVTTLAGGNYYPGSNDGTGSNASFYGLQGIAYDGSGNLYAADQSNGSIRKVAIATGAVTTFSTGFSSPMGIAYDGGNVYVTEQSYQRIRKIVISTGTVTTVAGSGNASFADGTGTAASFYNPAGITADGSGNLYVADQNNHRIRKIVISTGAVTTVAGNGNATFVDGAAATASFNNPYSVALGGDGYLYVADQSNHRIRKVSLLGYSITPALPTGLSFDGTTGTITGTPTVVTPAADYTVTATNNIGTSTATVNISVVLPVPTITSFTPTSVGAGQTVIITGTGFTGTTSVTFGGTPAAYTVISGTSIKATVGVGSSGSVVVITPGGTATLAGFTMMTAPSITYAGPQAYTTGTAIAALSPVNTGGTIPSSTYGATTTLAGSTYGSANGTGTAATFGHPYGVAADGAGNLYIADYYNHKIRKVVISTGAVSTLAGSGTDAFADGTGAAASFNYPTGIVADKLGNLYVSDQLNNRIRKIVIATGAVSTLAGNGTDGFADGSGTSANFSSPIGIATDGSSVYVADANNNRIRKVIISSGLVSTLAGNSSASFVNGTGTAASFSNPSGVTYDGNGNLYIADQYNNRIRKIVISTGVVTTLAGSGTANATDGTGTAAGFDNPVDVSFDGIGNVYVTDQNNNKIRKVATATGVVTTVAGSSAGTTDGTGAAAKFNSPAGILADNAGNVYVADLGNDRIRTIKVTGYNLNMPLPAGLTLDGATGTISGTPTVETAATAYSITASNAAGTSTTTVSIAVVAEPTITSFLPTSASAGQTVTITGTNFTGVSSVSFGGTAATSFTVVSPTSITAVVAAGTSGSVSVVKAGITASLAGFTFIQPTASIAGTAGVCLNGTAPTVTFTGANGIAPYTFTYKINSGSNQTVTTTTGSSVTVAAPTGAAGTFNYTLISVADNNTNAQAQSGTAVITVNALPVVTTQAVTPVCGALTANLSTGITSSTTGLTVEYYSNPALTAAVTNPVSTSGTYYVKVISSSNCSASASIVVNAFKAAPAAPTVSIVQPTCASATATVTVTSATAGLTFSSDGTMYTNTTGVFTVAAGTAYSITARNSDGCVSSAAAGTVNAQPPTPSTPTVTVTQPTCAVATASIKVVSTGASSYSLVIDGTTFTNATGIFNNIAAGAAYSVTTTSAAGCTSATATGTVDVQPATPAAPTVSVTQPTCAVATATVTVTSSLTGLTFSNDGTTYTNTTGIFTVAAGTTFGITARNASGCISVAATGSINAQPATPAVPTVSVTQPTCGTATATITVTSSLTGLTFSNDGTTYTNTTGVFTAAAGSAYSITAKTTAGCISAAATGTVNAQPTVPAVPTVSVTQPTCSTATATVTVTSSLTGLTFSSDGTTYTNTTGVFTVAAGAAYSITAKSVAGCISAAATGTVNVQPLAPGTPSVNVTQPTCAVATASMTVTSTGATSFTLVSDGTTFINSTGVFSNLAAGSAYSVTTTNSGGCVSTATTGTINAQPATPAVPTVSVTQPTCATATATVTVTSSLTGFTFSNDGTTYTNTTGIFTGIAAGSIYSITAKNASGCISAAVTGSINAQPATPTAPTVSVTQPTCSTATATVTVTSALTGLTFSSDGTTYTNTTGIFTGLAAGSSYSITARNASGCISTAATGSINAQPATPTVPTVSVTQPTCTVATATVTVTSSTTGLTFSKDGTDYSNTTGVFPGIAAGSSYSITAKNASGCISTAATGTVNAQPAAPAAPTVSIAQPTCATATATVTVTSSLTGFTFSNDGTTYTNTTGIFTGMAAGSTYSITAKNTAGCISIAATGTINAQPSTPAAPTVSVTQPTCGLATATVTVTSALTGFTFSSDGTTYTNTTGVFAGLAAGSSYSITARNASGCISTAATGTVNAQPVTPVTPAVSIVQPTCTTATASITVTSAGAASFTLVSNGTTFINSTGVFANLAAGSAYSVTTTSSAGCVSAAVSGTIDAQPAVPAVPTVNVTQPTCATATATITVTSTITGLTFSSDGSTYTNTTGVFSNIAAGTSYSITAKNASGCVSTAATGTINAQPGAPFTPVVSVTQPTCTTATATVTVISGTTGLTFSSDGSTYTNTTGVFAGLTAGSTYSITSRNASGCISSAATGTISSAPAPPAAPTVSIAQPTCTTATATISVTSSLTGLTFSSDGTTYTNTTGVFTGIAAGASYSITSKTGAGCISVAATGTISAQPATPTVAAITGTTTVCAGAATTLSSTTTGGAWSSSATNIATVNSSTGEVTGVTGGTATITYTVSNGTCSNTASTTVTVNSYPVVAAITNNTVLCFGSTNTLSSTTPNGAWSSSNASVASINSSTGLVTATGAGSATITYTVSNGGCSSTATAVVNVKANGSWTGTSSNVWTDLSNWCNGVPTGTSDATILATATNMPVLTGTQSVRNITVETGASLTITGTLKVAGNIANSGSITATAGSLEFNGSTVQTAALGTMTAVKNVTINSTGGVVLGSSISISGTLTSTAGNLHLGNSNIILLSTAAATARIAPVAGTFTYGTGNFVQQRFVPAKPARTWSLVASPFNQSIAAAWQQQVHITGAGTGGTVCPALSPNSNGFDATATNAGSMFMYDGSKLTGTRWASVLGTNTQNLAPGNGYRMNIRGPRSLGCSLLDGTVLYTSDAVMMAAGTLSNANRNMGSFNITYTNNGDATVANDNYLMIGNPYPSEVSFAQLKADNPAAIGNSYAIYGPQNSVGNYAYWNGSTFTGGNTGLDDTKGDVIANGQAIFIKGAVPGANITLGFNEGQKTNIANNGYFRTQSNPNMLRIGYILASGAKADEIILQFANNGTTEQLNADDIESMNTGSQNLKSIKGTKGMAINTRPLNFINDTVALNVASTANGQFKLNFSGYAGFAGANIYLIDQYTHTVQFMNSNPEYAFTVNTSDSATRGAGRFKVVFTKQAVAVPVTVVPTAIRVYPNPVKDLLKVELPQAAGTYTLKMMDLRGRVVAQQKAAAGSNSINMSTMITGIYMLEVTSTNGTKETVKIVKQ